MKSKHEEEEPEKENSERWMLTYADLITLLLALFIVMYAISTVDADKMKALGEGFNEAFNGSSQGEGSGSGVAAAETSGAGTETSVTGYSGDSLEPSPLDEIYQELSAYIRDNNLEGKIDLENDGTFVKITLKEVVLFVPDKSTMLEDSAPVLLEIEKAVSSVYEKIDNITISGHTADADNDATVSSNFAWQLSTERAVTVLNYLANNGLPQYKLSIEGHSHFDPIAENDTAEGRAKNRRVEITIYKDKPVSVTAATTTTTSVTTVNY